MAHHSIQNKKYYTQSTNLASVHQVCSDRLCDVAWRESGPVVVAVVQFAVYRRWVSAWRSVEGSSHHVSTASDV